MFHRSARIACYVLLSLWLVFGHETAVARPLDGIVDVTTRDVSTKGPVRAQVVLDGPITVADITDVDGEVRFENIIAGKYTVRITANGYTSAVRAVTVEAGAVVQIDAQLVQQAKRLKQIAVVAVRSSNSQGRYTIGAESAVNNLTPSTLSALTSIPGVFTNPAAENGSLVFASIEGHGVSETGLLLDGVPLNIPGTSVNLASFDTDLTSGTSVSYGASANGEAATLSFRTLDPTTTWQTHADGSLGPYNRSFVNLSEQGTYGRLGIVAQHAFRATNSPLTDAVFSDSTGMSYLHAGDAIDEGSVLKLRYNAGKHVVTATGIESSTYSALLCATFTNPLPCGYGPGNSSTGVFHLFNVADQASIGQTTWTLGGYRLTSSADDNYANLIVSGVRLPVVSSSDFQTSGVTLGGQLPVGFTDATLSFSAGSSAQAGNSSSLGSTSNVSRANSISSAAASDSFRIGPKVLATASLDATRIGGIGSTEEFVASGSVRHNLATTSGIAFAFGKGLNPDGTQTLFTPPVLLQYDCAAGTVTGSAPGDPSANNNFMSARYTFDKRIGRGEITLQAYVSDERGVAVNALVNGGLLPPGYFAAINQLYQSPGNCGAESSLSPANVYFSKYVSGVHVLYDGIHAVGSTQVMKHLSLEGNVSLTRAAAWSNDRRLTDPLTLFQQGRQLPGVPQLSGYADIAYKPDNAPEWLLGAAYSGYGNARNVSPSLAVNAAFVQRLQRGQLAVLIENAFNTHPGAFAVPAPIDPYVTAAGSPVGGIAYPFTPRSITVSYSGAVGRDAVTTNSVERSMMQASGATDDALVPGTMLVKWPSSKPANAFVRNTGSKCTSGQLAKADSFLDPLKELVDRLNSSRPSQPADLPNIASLKTHYQPIGGSYALTMVSTKISMAQAPLDCALVHVGIEANASSAGLPFPPTQSLVDVSFYYTPEIGIYFIQQPPAKGVAQKFRYYNLPSKRPSAPFALNDQDICLPELRPIAARMLSQLAAFFAAAQPDPALAPDWKVVRHDGSGVAGWYELKTDDIGGGVSIANCAHVSKGTHEQLKARGVDGVAGSFNYSPDLGIYVVTR